MVADSGGDFLAEQVATVRHDGGHARADGSDAFLQLAFAGNEADMTDAHAGHVGDGVERSGRQATGLDAQITHAHG